MIIAEVPPELWSKDIAAVVLGGASCLWWWRNKTKATAFFGTGCLLWLMARVATSLYISRVDSAQTDAVSVGILTGLSLGILAYLAGAAGALIVIWGLIREGRGRSKQSVPGSASEAGSGRNTGGL